MRGRKHNRLVAGAVVAGLWLTACPAAQARPGAPPASEEDWQAALAAVRGIALDAKETEDHRANAITACAKLLVARNRHDEALGLCREVLQGPAEASVAGAALRAACLVQRGRHGHLRAEMDFLASCSRGPGAQLASALVRELSRVAQALGSLAGRTMVPGPVVPGWPRWAAATADKGPSALQVEPPRIGPPQWLGRASFPLLKEPGRK